jgi:hypothetical protein
VNRPLSGGATLGEFESARVKVEVTANAALRLAATNLIRDDFMASSDCLRDVVEVSENGPIQRRASRPLHTRRKRALDNSELLTRYRNYCVHSIEYDEKVK